MNLVSRSTRSYNFSRSIVVALLYTVLSLDQRNTITSTEWAAVLKKILLYEL